MKFVYVEDIGIDVDGCFVDKENYIIGVIFKLYFWEDMFCLDYVMKIVVLKMWFIELVWKFILFNKGILFVLWEFFLNYFNFLLVYFEVDLWIVEFLLKYVCKFIYLCEGVNVEIIDSGVVVYVR